jgi:hypothetical protein
MPSLRDEAHDGWLCTSALKQQLEIASARSWEAPVRATGTVLKRLTDGPSITYELTPVWSLSSSQPGGPPCWASPLAFGLIGFYSNRLEIQ